MKKWLKHIIRFVALAVILMCIPTLQAKAKTSKEVEIFVDDYRGVDKKITGSVEYFGPNAYAINQGEGKPVKGATVYIKYKNKTYKAVTNAKGRFAIKKVPVIAIGKKIKVFAQKTGYKKKSIVIESEAVGEMAVTANAVTYGSLKLTGRVTREDGNFHDKGLGGVTVTLKYKGKKYSAKTNKAGNYAIKNIPVLKPNTYVSVVATKKGFKAVSDNSYVSSPSTTSDIWHQYSYDSSTKQSGYITNSHRGDTLKITIGNKVYTKKISKNAKKFSYTVPTAKFKAGTVIRFQLIGKYGDVWVDYKDVIYGYSTFKKGDTKAHILLTAGYRYPTREVNSSYGLTWYYGSYDYITFDTDGKVTEWYFNKE